jgi:uncharacterized membrane protein YciS (DUF1049 family)
MSFKAFLKTLWFLAMLFIVLYVGMNNLQVIDFNFPIAGTTAKNPIHAQAALIFFGVFAIGMLAGMVLHTGGGKKKAASKD